MTTPTITRRAALQVAAGFAAPFVFRHHATAAPSDTLAHASFGAGGMAGSDINSLTGSKNLKLVAVADVDLTQLAAIKKRFPDVRIYQDWRELLDKEKKLDSANISTPDHMHGAITMRAMQQGVHVYTQKPLTQTIYEARQLTKVADEKKLVTQMGIQIHSGEVHRAVVAMIQDGVIGKVKEVHSWSNKDWGDLKPTPTRKDMVPASLNWDFWLGVAAARPFIAGYYHPGNWRRRIDFGTGTFGDMGCHILDPVFASLALTAPKSVRSDGGAAGTDNWGLNSRVTFVFPATKYTDKTLVLHWYDGNQRPDAAVKALLGKRTLSDQGSIYIGDKGVLYSPYIAAPVLLPEKDFAGYKRPNVGGNNHYLEFVEACRGKGKTSTPFSYSGPLTESVLLGCLATRFDKQLLEWDAKEMKVTNVEAANAPVRRKARKGWEVEGL